MATRSLLTKVKSALRISTSLLDDDIGDHIRVAKAELKRVGVDEDLVDDEGDTVCQAIKFYVLSQLSGDEKARDGFHIAYEQLADELRKTYPQERDTDV